MTSQSAKETILVIKLGSLGDFIQAFDAFNDIRAFHAAARVALLTTPPFAQLARRSPWFDEVSTDGRLKWTDIADFARMAWRLRRGSFARVYDLQQNHRSAMMFRIVGAKRGPPWFGKAPGCAFPEPAYDIGADNVGRLRAHLESAGVPSAGAPDLAWLAGDIGALKPQGRFVLMAPGCSPHRPRKRWPSSNYAELGARLNKRGYRIAVVGTAADREAIEVIVARLPEAIDLGGRTDLFQLASLAREAAAFVGNDTGPTFLCAKIGAPTLTLMSVETDEVRMAPRGRSARWIKRDNLADLGVDEVEAALNLP
ncbi:MAG TPA: glycosyltransferase family 9 protein [Roseiarcus sp.]|nr:glycosyltransferase family 9 protein [Roseiarcus sp.]